MSKPRIYINPGHSDKDPGAVGYEVERDLNVKVSNYQRDYLLANYDCEVRMNPGTMGNLYDICEDANRWGANLFVSNHNNAGKGDGYEALVNSEATRELGEIFERRVKAVGQNSRGVKIRTGLVVLRETNMPAVLNEGAFVDNLKDIQDWNDDAELKKLGEAYAKAAAEFVGAKKKDAKPKTVTVTLPVLSRGSKGKAVEALQILMKGRWYGVGVTGSFGDGTKATVEKVQKDNNLPVTGVADAATWEALIGTK